MTSDHQPKIIVAGKIYVVSGRRDELIHRSLDAVTHARNTHECLDFAVSADPVEPDRVNIFEVWTSVQALQEFRGNGPGEDLSQLIDRVEVTEYRL